METDRLEARRSLPNEKVKKEPDQSWLSRWGKMMGGRPWSKERRAGEREAMRSEFEKLVEAMGSFGFVEERLLWSPMIKSVLKMKCANSSVEAARQTVLFVLGVGGPPKLVDAGSLEWGEEELSCRKMAAQSTASWVGKKVFTVEGDITGTVSSWLNELIAARAVEWPPARGSEAFGGKILN